MKEGEAEAPGRLFHPRCWEHLLLVWPAFPKSLSFPKKINKIHHRSHSGHCFLICAIGRSATFSDPSGSTVASSCEVSVVSSLLLGVSEREEDRVCNTDALSLALSGNKMPIFVNWNGKGATAEWGGGRQEQPLLCPELGGSHDVSTSETTLRLPRFVSYLEELLTVIMAPFLHKEVLGGKKDLSHFSTRVCHT